MLQHTQPPMKMKSRLQLVSFVISSFALWLPFSSASGLDNAFWLGQTVGGPTWTWNWTDANWASDQAGTPSAATPSTIADVVFSATGAAHQLDTVLDADTTIQSLIVNSSAGITPFGSTTLTITGALYVNDGNLNLANGLTVENDLSIIGNQNGGTASVTVSDAGTTWTNDNLMYVGDAGSNATLTITNGGVLNAGGAIIGNDVNSTGNIAYVTGSGSQWNITNGVNIGGDGNSNTLNIEAGGAMTSGSVIIGDKATSHDNSATVTGAGSTWSTGLVYVGGSGSTNHLTISDGGVLDAQGNALVIGHDAGSSYNTVMVTGADSDLKNVAGLYVGENGSYNTLTVEDGGHLSSGASFVGFAATSNYNTAVVSGTDTSWDVAKLHVGFYGASNTLTISDGATVTVTSSDADGTFIGYGTSLATSDSNKITVDGGTLINDKQLTVGNYGKSNQLEIKNGGQVSDTNGLIGFRASGSDNSVIVSGTDSQWTNSGFLYVGRQSANNTLTIEDNAVVQANGQDTNGFSTIIGFKPTATNNTVNVTTGGSLVNGVALVVGESGQGTLNITSGGSVDVNSGAGKVTLGDLAGSSGTLNIGQTDLSSTGGTLTADEVYGGAGTAVLNFNQTDEITLAAKISGSVSINQLGSGTSTITGDLTQTGSATVTDGTLLLGGDTSGFTGDITNNATLVFNSSADTSYNGKISGSGTLTKEGTNKLVLTGDDSADTTNLNAGTLWVQNALTTGTLNIASGATLGGIGTINGNVINAGAVSPGNSPGTLTINGDYTQMSGGVFNLEIASPTVFDQLLVSGTATTAGTLNIILTNGFTGLTLGQQVPFLVAQNGVVNNFDTITGSFVSSDFRGRLILDNGTLILVVAPTSYANLITVPLTQNEKNVAKALDSFSGATSGDKQTVSTELDMLTASQYARAFDSISPAQYSGLATTAIDAGNSQSQFLQQRFSSLRVGNGRGLSVQGMKTAANDVIRYNEPKTATDVGGPGNFLTAPDSKWGSWVQSNGVFGDTSKNAGVSDSKTTSAEGLFGLDYAFNKQVVFGGYVGYNSSRSKYDNGGRNDMDAASLGAYMTYVSSTGFYTNLIAGASLSHYDIDRPVVVGGITRTATSSPYGRMFNGTVESGYGIKRGNWTINPTVAVQGSSSSVDSFTETGANSLDLHLRQDNAYSLRSSAGARLAYNWKLSRTVTVIPQASALWQHEYLGNARTLHATLDGGNGAPFDYRTETVGRNSAYTSAGFSVNFAKSWDVSATYGVNFGRGDYNSQAVSLDVGYKF